MARFRWLPAVALAFVLAVPLVALAAPQPQISYGTGSHTERIAGGGVVTYAIPFTMTAADGESTVDIEIAYRERPATNLVAWNATLGLVRSAGEQPPRPGPLTALNAPVKLDNIRDGSYQLSVTVTTADNVAQYTSFIELIVSKPDGSNRVSAGDWRFDFNVDNAPDADGDGLSDATEARLGTNKDLFDTDADGLTDCQEYEHTVVRECQDPTFLAVDGGFGTDPKKKDTDGDTLSDFDELNLRTNPLKADSDDDGLRDDKELDPANDTDPLDPDTDDDGLKDGDEITAKANPKNKDTDGDGLLDGEEFHGTRNGAHGNESTDPTKRDSDEDSLTDCQELRHTDAQQCTNLAFPSDDGGFGTNPNSKDTDGDGIEDTNEVSGGTSALKADTDDDGLSDFEEVFTHQTNPTDPDMDKDGLLDGEEILTWKTDPKKPDTDGDGLTDGDEVHTYGSDPTLFDTDDDELNDGAEVNVHGTDPASFDTDGDGLIDGLEIRLHKTDPLVSDSDDDGLIDGDEVALGTDPAVPDTDGDGWLDGVEVRVGTLPLGALSFPSDVDGDRIADVEDDDADGDGRPDDEVAAGVSRQLGESMRVARDLGRTDVKADGTIDVQLAWDAPETGDVQVWRLRNHWVMVDRLPGADGGLLVTDGRDADMYRITAFTAIGDKLVGGDSNATWFEGLPSTEVFVTGVKPSGETVVAARNGGSEARAFDVEVDAGGDVSTQSVDVRPKSQETLELDLSSVPDGADYVVYWNDGGQRIEVMRGTMPGDAKEGAGWLVWGLIGAVVAAVAVGGALFAVKMKRRA